MRRYTITITAQSPMLMHADNIEWQDSMSAWKQQPENRRASTPGDDRSPGFRWLGSLHHNGTHICLPAESIMRCVMGAGAMMNKNTGKATFKSQTQSGMMMPQVYYPLLIKGKQVPVAPFFEAMEGRSFDGFQEMAAEHGFMLFVKRARIGRAKHIRVRPRFDNWSCTAAVLVVDNEITDAVLQELFRIGGQYKGLGDWRPGGITPGPYGMFTASVVSAPGA